VILGKLGQSQIIQQRRLSSPNVALDGKNHNAMYMYVYITIDNSIFFILFIS
jgi:hypothetical protein